MKPESKPKPSSPRAQEQAKGYWKLHEGFRLIIGECETTVFLLEKADVSQKKKKKRTQW